MAEDLYFIDKKLTAKENLITLVNHDNVDHVGEPLTAAEVNVVLPETVVEPEGYKDGDNIEYTFGLVSATDEKDKVEGLSHTRLGLNNHILMTVANTAWFADVTGQNDVENPNATTNKPLVESQVSTALRAWLGDNEWRTDDETLISQKDGVLEVFDTLYDSATSDLRLGVKSLMFRHRNSIKMPVRLVDIVPTFQLAYETFPAEHKALTPSAIADKLIVSFNPLLEVVEHNLSTEAVGEDSRLITITRRTPDEILTVERPAKVAITPQEFAQYVEMEKINVDQVATEDAENELGYVINTQGVLTALSASLNVSEGFTFTLMKGDKAPARAKRAVSDAPQSDLDLFLVVEAEANNPVWKGSKRFQLTTDFGLANRILVKKLDGFTDPQVTDGDKSNSLKDVMETTDLGPYRE